MAEERERFPRATGTEAETAEAPQAEASCDAAEVEDTGTDVARVPEPPVEAAEVKSNPIEVTDATEDPSSAEDWLGEAEADLGYWLDESFEMLDEAGDWGFDEDDEGASLLGGSGASAERCMSEASSLIALSEFGLAEGSVHVAGETEDEDDVAGMVARVVPTSPLLGLLDSEWLRALPDMGQVVRVVAGETIVEEGDDGDSLYLILSGSVSAEVFDRESGEMLRVSTLRPGDFFGESALLSDAVRSATLRAVADTIAIELESEAVLTLVENQPSVIKLLMRYFRARMVGVVVATAQLFQPCSIAERRELITRFRLREVAPDTMVVRPGDAGDGLYLVVDGELSVLSADGKVLRRARRGDVYGERSLVDGFPSATGLRAETRCWVLRMPRSEFLEAICRHPHLLEQVNQVTDAAPAEQTEI